MGAHRTARRIVAACEECGRTTGDRSVTTQDGYTLQRQPDGSWTDGDLTFGSLDEIESQVGIGSLGPGESGYRDPADRALCLECWQEDNAVCAGCDEPFPHSELSPDDQDELRCGKCLADLKKPFSQRPDRHPQASQAAAEAIDGIGARLMAAIEREAMWRSALRDKYDDDFGQWLAYSDMYGLAGRLGFATAEEAWEANPTVQGATDPQDFRVAPEGERMDMELSAALGWICESCGSDTGPGEPCDCVRRPEARQPDLSGAVRAARESLDMGDLVIRESPPVMGGMDVYRKGGEGDLEKVTFLNERGMEELGEWITNASKAARRIAILAPGLVRRPPAKPVSVDRDVDTEGMEPETCPRCKGHGGVFPADEGEDCNLCDGHGEVFRHADGSYSNATDRSTYLY